MAENGGNWLKLAKTEYLLQSTLVIVYLVIVESLVIVDKSLLTDFLLSKISCNSGFSMIYLNL